MHKITSITDIKPYQITVIFDKQEKRVINFETIVDHFPILKDPEIFKMASIDDYPTIKWDGLARMKELDGTIVPAPLDFCPDSLYMMSVAA